MMLADATCSVNQLIFQVISNQIPFGFGLVVGQNKLFKDVNL